MPTDFKDKIRREIKEKTENLLNEIEEIEKSTIVNVEKNKYIIKVHPCLDSFFISIAECEYPERESTIVVTKEGKAVFRKYVFRPNHDHNDIKKLCQDKNGKIFWSNGNNDTLKINFLPETEKY